MRFVIWIRSLKPLQEVVSAAFQTKLDKCKCICEPSLNYETTSEHLDFDFMVLYNAFVLSWGLTITQNSIRKISDLDRSRLTIPDPQKMTVSEPIRSWVSDLCIPTMDLNMMIFILFSNQDHWENLPVATFLMSFCFLYIFVTLSKWNVQWVALNVRSVFSNTGECKSGNIL